MGQAGYEYKLFVGRTASAVRAEESEAALNCIAREGWRVVAVPAPAEMARGYFVLLLEREIPTEGGAQAEIDRLRLEAAKVDLEAAELRLVKVKLEIEMARMPPLRTQPDIHPSLCWPEPAEIAREIDTSPPGSTSHNNLVLGHVRARSG